MAKQKKKQSDGKKKKVGRPSKYKGDETCCIAYKLALLGLIDIKIAEYLEVNQDTIYEWKKKYPEFSEALKKGKIIADGEVVESLYRRATGYDYFEEKDVKDGNTYDIVSLKKHSPPDVGACMAWLKNRQPEIWRDKHDIEQGDISVNVKFDV